MAQTRVEFVAPGAEKLVPSSVARLSFQLDPDKGGVSLGDSFIAFVMYSSQSHIGPHSIDYNPVA
jgi:hypothetical protein